MKESTSRFSQHLLFAASASCLPTTGPGQGLEWESRLASVLARSRDQGQFRRPLRTSESWSCSRRLTNVDKKLMRDSVVCLWLLVFQKLDRCHWMLLSGRQILLARSAVIVMISSLSLSIYLSRSPSPSPSLSLSLSLTHTHTHILYLYFAFHSQAHQWTVHLHVYAVTVFCSVLC